MKSTSAIWHLYILFSKVELTISRIEKYSKFMKIDQFEKLKDESLGHSLIKAARLHNDYAFSELKKKIKLDHFRPSHLQLFPHIPFEGITIVELAKKLEISKQAVSVLVNDLLNQKVLIKKANPQDKRSFLITFSKNKNVGVFRGMQFLSSLDQDLKKVLTKQEYDIMKKGLDKIISQYC